MVREDCQEEKERALAARDRTIASLKEDCERMHRELMELRMDSHGTGNFGSLMSHQNDSILGELCVYYLSLSLTTSVKGFSVVYVSIVLCQQIHTKKAKKLSWYFAMFSDESVVL